MKTTDLLLVCTMIVGAACGDTDVPLDMGPLDVGSDSSADVGPDMPAPLDLGTDAPDAAPRLPPGIVPLDGRDPSLPTDDLAALGRLIGDASVVALGESVHTTRGYSEMKDRLFRYLVTELGFRVFAFENPRTQAERGTIASRSPSGDRSNPWLVYFPIGNAWNGSSDPRSKSMDSRRIDRR